MSQYRVLKNTATNNVLLSRAKGKVVDKVLAKPWRPAYASKVPAQYTIEARPSLLDKVSIGDRLVWE